ncbi:hypothetical protein OG884_37325 [Streptosporangium sp. NBC_01755]|nr:MULTISPECIES: hypothetical protein [unclassified Streptosporangium]WSA28170.1 hypothetical protein OIE13_10015 [Streptosporangium sp. NBC_01810]WSD00354.1 hypothetical protein OG884_37325 [Streptosporangium sp. NBC_01755]
MASAASAAGTGSGSPITWLSRRPPWSVTYPSTAWLEGRPLAARHRPRMSRTRLRTLSVTSGGSSS